MVLGPIPEAPGLQDLDTIHPVEEMIQIEKDEGPMPLPLPEIAPLPINPLPVEESVVKKKKSSKAKRLLIVLVMFTGLGAAGWYAWSNGLI